MNIIVQFTVGHSAEADELRPIDGECVAVARSGTFSVDCRRAPGILNGVVAVHLSVLCRLCSGLTTRKHVETVVHGCSGMVGSGRRGGATGLDSRPRVASEIIVLHIGKVAFLIGSAENVYTVGVGEG